MLSFFLSSEIENDNLPIMNEVINLSTQLSFAKHIV